MHIAVQLPMQEKENTAVVLPDGTVRLESGEEFTFEQDASQPNVFYALVDGKKLPIVTSAGENNTVVLSFRGYRYVVGALTEREQVFRRLLKQTVSNQSRSVRLVAPMPGLIKSVTVANGQEVKKGDRLFILEAMKMENDIKAPADGIIGKISVEAGQAVEKSVLLCVIDPPTASA